MEDGNGSNQRRNSLQIYQENDRTTNRRRQTNETDQVVNEPQHDDNDDEQLPLSLSLGSTSYSSRQSQIPPVMSSLRLVPSPAFDGPNTTRPSPADMTARMISFMTSSRYLPSSSLHQTGSQPIQPPVNFFPVSTYGPQSNQSIPAERLMVKPITATVRNSRSQSTGNNNTIPPPFPWATNIKGKIHSLEYLEAKQITTITGDVQCKYCERVYQVSYNLRERFREVEIIFMTLRRNMRDRAPPMWANPEPRRCELCGREKAVKPVIAERKCMINWLFLLLGQSLGYCTLQQLKNFCKHSKNHRTGAKDRVLYLTYLGLYKMLQPDLELSNRESTLKR